MKLKPSFLLKLAGLTVCALSLIQDVKAQPFAYNTNDIFVGFRKTGANQGSYELVVDIGQGTDYIGMTPGAVSNIANFSPTQLSDAFSNYNNLNWSVSGGQDGGLTPPPGYPARTLWLTAPRANASVQSTPIQRDTTANQQLTTVRITSVLDGAALLSSGLPADQDNNGVLLREPAGDDNAYSSFVSGADPNASTYQDTLLRSIENVTPASFSSPARSDLYEVRPTGFTDPNTGLTSGDAYYAGYFQLNTDGTMTFTRASANTPPPPPSPVLKITRSGSVNTISFGTTNGATYNLYLTNSAGLSQHITNWPTGGSLVGDGNTNSFFDTTTDSNRFYSVIAH